MQRKAYGSLTKIFMCLARKQTKPKHGGICLRPHGNRPLLPSRAICRFQSVSRGFCTRGGSGATVSPFRRNGITVPAQRGDRSSFYAINKLRGATKAPLTFRHSLRPHAPSKGRDRSPLPPAPPLPPGRGGSPLPPASPPHRPRSGLSKCCSPMFGSGTCGSPWRSVSEALCCSSEFLLTFLHSLHG